MGGHSSRWMINLCVLIWILLIGISLAKENQANECLEQAFGVSCEDNFYTSLENEEDEEKSNESHPYNKRKRRNIVPAKALPEPLEKNFDFIDDKTLFYDLLDGTAPHDKKDFHEQEPNGFAPTDRTKFLLFDMKNFEYPPFTYRGLYGRSNWHKIPIQNLMKKRNRSFMMLEHKCEQAADRMAEKICIKNEWMNYENLSRCDTAEQSPINIVKKSVRDSQLVEFQYSNLIKNGDAEGFDYLMSVPWDGTDLLTVEINDAGRPIVACGGSITGECLSLERIHIHFGENETVGSEHTIDHMRYAMELQFIFTLREQPDRARTDLQYWDLLMEYQSNDTIKHGKRFQNVHIMSLWVKVLSDDEFEKDGDWKDDWNRGASEAFFTLSKAARKFWAIHNRLKDPCTITTPPTPPPPAPKPCKYRAVKNKVGQDQLFLGKIFPPQVFDPRRGNWRDSVYYNYKGTITHPPCFGYVEWNIYDRPLQISYSTWKHFLYIHSEFDDTKFMAGNYRLPSHVFVNTLHERDRDWTSAKDAERQRTLKKMENRDVRKSKPKITSGSKDYDYYSDQRNGCDRRTMHNNFIIICYISVFTYL